MSFLLLSLNSSPLVSFPFLSFPFLSFPFLSLPFLSFRFLSFPFLFFPFRFLPCCAARPQSPSRPSIYKRQWYTASFGARRRAASETAAANFCAPSFGSVKRLGPRARQLGLAWRGGWGGVGWAVLLGAFPAPFLLVWLLPPTGSQRA